MWRPTASTLCCAELEDPFGWFEDLLLICLFFLRHLGKPSKFSFLMVQEWFGEELLAVPSAASGLDR